jgi:hypothetical protein
MNDFSQAPSTPLLPLPSTHRSWKTLAQVSSITAHPAHKAETDHPRKKKNLEEVLHPRLIYSPPWKQYSLDLLDAREFLMCQQNLWVPKEAIHMGVLCC